MSCDLQRRPLRAQSGWRVTPLHTCLSVCSLSVLHDAVVTPEGSAVVTPEGSTVVTQGGKLEASCNARSSLPTQTVWLKVRTPCTRC